MEGGKRKRQAKLRVTVTPVDIFFIYFHFSQLIREYRGSPTGWISVVGKGKRQDSFPFLRGFFSLFLFLPVSLLSFVYGRFDGPMILWDIIELRANPVIWLLVSYLIDFDALVLLDHSLLDLVGC